MYLIECQCILENLDTDNLLKGYLLAELGFIYEVKGVFKEAGLLLYVGSFCW